MRIRTLTTVEDSNQFTLAELEEIPGGFTPYTLATKPIEAFGDVVGAARVDKFPANVEVDVPTRQGNALVTLGYAVAVS